MVASNAAMMAEACSSTGTAIKPKSDSSKNRTLIALAVGRLLRGGAWEPRPSWPRLTRPSAGAASPASMASVRPAATVCKSAGSPPGGPPAISATKQTRSWSEQAREPRGPPSRHSNQRLSLKKPKMAFIRPDEAIGRSERAGRPPGRPVARGARSTAFGPERRPMGWDGLDWRLSNVSP